MKKELLFIPLAVVFVFFFLSTLSMTLPVTVSVQTDKSEYQSSEIMNVYLEVSSPRYIGEAFVRVHGVTNRFGTEYVNQIRLVEIGAGTTQVNMSERLPVCSACSGLSAGTHTITAEVLVNNTAIASKTFTISLS